MSDACPRCEAELSPGANFCARCGAQTSAEGATEAVDPLIGRLVLTRYRVVRQLATGGMGRVYLAEQAMGQATRPVALKTLRRELLGDPKVSGRFTRESEIVIRLAHPNTIQFYDFGQLDDGTLVIVMEYIEGRTLADEMRGHTLPLSRVDALLTQICGSLAEAHAHGIVHRDIKPHNVLLTNRAGQDDFVKVVDFGIAAMHGGDAESAATRLTTHGTLVGTPPYMSPEQFQDRNVDPRSDVYSLGVMLYEMLTGALPFDAKSTWQWAAAHLEHAPRPITEHPRAKDLPDSRARCVMRALEKDPERRPRDAGELLREWLGDDASADAGKAQRDTSRSEVFVAPTLRAELPRSRPSAWLSWTVLGVGLVVGAVALTAWRGGRFETGGQSMEADGDVGVPHAEAHARVVRTRMPRSRASAARAPVVRGAAAADSATVAAAASTGADAAVTAPTPSASSAQPSGPGAEELLVEARRALDQRNVVAAAVALRSARALEPERSELKQLQTRLSELASERAADLGRHNACAALLELSDHLSSAGAPVPAGLQQALQQCRPSGESPINSTPNSTLVQ
jgi:serine/threonine-protein kinase